MPMESIFDWAVLAIAVAIAFASSSAVGAFLARRLGARESRRHLRVAPSETPAVVEPKAAGPSAAVDPLPAGRSRRAGRVRRSSAQGGP
jgi:hypothetical protein